MNIKVCGVTKTEQLVYLDKMAVEYAGLVFDSRSAHDIRHHIKPSDLQSLGLNMQIVGRFKNGSIDFILEYIEKYRFNVIQIDHSLSASECGLLSEQVEVIKTVYLKDGGAEEVLQSYELYDDVSDYYCFDLLKGNGFPWNLPEMLPIEKPFFIGGSWLQPSDASILHRYFHPDFYGADLGSAFEKSPGDKDTALIMSFIKSVNQVDN